MRSVLVLRALGLGDHLTGIPALRALRQGLPDHELVLAAPGTLRPLCPPDVADRLLPTGELQPVPWCGRPPDLAVDLHGNGPASRHLLDELGARRVLAFHGGPEWRPEEPERVRWCRLLEEGLGIDADPDDLRLRPPPPLLAGAVVVHPGAAYASRRWPPERFAAVAAALAADGQRVVVSGGPDEASLVEDVRRRAGLPPALAVLPRDLSELAGLVGAARLLVVGDTGVAHLASAYATPSVLLFGPTPPSRWGPPPGPHTVLWPAPDDRYVGDPHGSQTDAVLARISVGAVLAAARRALAPPAPAPEVAPAGARR